MDALVVDDDVSVRAYLCRLLEREGWSVRGCGGYDEAIAAAEEETFRVAFVDVHLGPSDGVELARCLRKLSPGLSVILMSGSGAQEERARRAGLEPILLKPLKPESICAVLSACEGDGEPA